MKNINVPNTLTLSGLLLGFFCLVLIYAQQSQWVYLCFPLLPLLDKLDGIAARRLQQNTALGAQLDSLSDLINFGLLPSILALSYWLTTDGFSGFQLAAIFAAACFVGCSAWRLARFNSDSSNHDGFIGLPTTNSGSWLFLAIIAHHLLPGNIANGALLATMLLLSIAMVGRFRYRNSSLWTLALYPTVPTAGIWMFISLG